ncbi:hypothetical protein M758_6G067300 [Ceratodon purpureus]|nr:hypothetical protein M758_6G067300 [Ceratodon purpureus]
MALIDYSYIDYLEQSISSIDVVQQLSKDQKVQVNPRQCEYLADKLTETGCFLRAKSDNLISIRDIADIRRKALLQLHFAVKRAEKLVRGCCCKTEPWLEAAVTLSHIKEDIKDILLDLRWWTSMIDIAIASVTWMSSGQKIVLELLRCAEEDYEKLLDNLHSSDNGLDRAASKDEDLLLRKVREVESSFAGAGSTPEQKHDYLLAVHVRSRLQNLEAETVEELNEYDDPKMIGIGGFGAVMNVRWFGRRCALKMLKQKCKTEATSLSEFQHPHIVKFFRYWEAPYDPTPNGTPNASSRDTPRSDNSMPFHVSLQSHILMELLPMDLNQHLVKLRNMVNFTVGARRKPEHTRGSPLPEDVALDVILQMVKAMWHLNSKDVAHRDLKPNNVLVRPVSDDEVPELNYRGYVRAKLADFGLAKTRALSSALSTQPVVGTKVYGAPEVFNQDIISDRRFPRKADVWSLGIMFCEILSGKPPFPAVEDQTMPLGELQGRIKKGLRPRLPENCPDYLKFIIESCWQLNPQDRPNFTDLWRLVRLAQVQNLGLIQKDHDLFAYRTRNGVRSLRPFKKTPADPATDPLIHQGALEGGLSKDSAGSSIWWIMIRWISYNLARRRDLSFQRGPSLKRGFSRASEVSTSRSQPESKPLGYLVNQMGPPNLDISSSKLDVIFFEGNVGTRKDMSCKDTWVQRGKPNVWWPRDWLPKDLGGDIRVLLLEYSISDEGIEGVLDQLQRLLVFSDRWNRKHTWERPIVLVGHSLGCVLIEHLVVALDRRVKSIQTLEDEVEIGRAKVAEAFLTSLAGCFFYAPPWTGLVPSEDLLKYVFGGLNYSRELFSDLCLDSPKLKLLSEDFVRAKRKHMKLTAVIEGHHTRGRTVVPPASMQDFEGTVVDLVDSNHADVCKPTDKQHRAYKEVLKFVGDILENSKAIQHPVDDKQQYLPGDAQQNLSDGKQQYFSDEKQQYLSSGKQQYLSNDKQQYLSTSIKQQHLSKEKQQHLSDGKQQYLSYGKQPAHDMRNHYK